MITYISTSSWNCPTVSHVQYVTPFSYWYCFWDHFSINSSTLKLIAQLVLFLFVLRLVQLAISVSLRSYPNLSDQNNREGVYSVRLCGEQPQSMPTEICSTLNVLSINRKTSLSSVTLSALRLSTCVKKRARVSVGHRILWLKTLFTASVKSMWFCLLQWCI